MQRLNLNEPLSNMAKAILDELERIIVLIRNNFETCSRDEMEAYIDGAEILLRTS